tara:strand:+ start:8874 stop:9782 length:909 start_codon:yes stop_codon:yes gene_type:complete
MKHLIDFEEWNSEDFREIIKNASIFKKGPQVPFFLSELHSIANLFLEASTRTRVSFEVAEQKLGLHPIYIDATASSIKKGETLYDTLKTLESIGVKACVLRASQEVEKLKELARQIKMPIINAGSGQSAHPTQALLDLMSIEERFGSLENLKIAFVGDIQHSRVVASHLQMWQHFPVQTYLCPIDNQSLDGYENYRMDDLLESVDVLYLMRVQNERHASMQAMTNEQYHEVYGLTEARYKQMKPGSIVMHPGPFIRDKEIASSLIEKKNVTIDQQVENGTFVRMAIIDKILGGKASESLLNS